MLNFFFSLPKSEISQFQLFTHNWKCQYALLGIVYSCTKKYIWFLCGILGLTVQKLKSLARNVRHFKKCFFFVTYVYISLVHSFASLPVCVCACVHHLFRDLFVCMVHIIHERHWRVVVCQFQWRCLSAYVFSLVHCIGIVLPNNKLVFDTVGCCWWCWCCGAASVCVIF